MKLLIKVTKDVLQRSMMCGTKGSKGLVVENCAVALAVRDIFPDAKVKSYSITPFSNLYPIQQRQTIPMPGIAIRFIEDFDSLKGKPELRLELPEFSFEINIPDFVLDHIGIKEITDIIEKSETLELVEDAVI